MVAKRLKRRALVFADSIKCSTCRPFAPPCHPFEHSCGRVPDLLNNSIGRRPAPGLPPRMIDPHAELPSHCRNLLQTVEEHPDCHFRVQPFETGKTLLS